MHKHLSQLYPPPQCMAGLLSALMILLIPLSAGAGSFTVDSITCAGTASGTASGGAGNKLNAVSLPSNGSNYTIPSSATSITLETSIPK
jgi:hypothetical protein